MTVLENVQACTSHAQEARLVRCDYANAALKNEEDGDPNRTGMELLKIFGLDKRAHELALQSSLWFAAPAGDCAGTRDETESAAAG